MSHSYDEAKKEKVRRILIKHINKVFVSRPKLKITTLASGEGLCVKAFVDSLTEPVITNVERDLVILKKFKKLKLPATSVLSDFETHYDKSGGGDVLFLDLCGFLSEGSNARLLYKLNTRADFKIVAVTLQDHKTYKAVRGNPKSKFIAKLNAMKAGTDDVVRDKVFSTMTNYWPAEIVAYRKTNVANPTPMQTYMFHIKDLPKPRFKFTQL